MFPLRRVQHFSGGGVADQYVPMIHATAVNYGINPRLMEAIFRWETGHGTSFDWRHYNNPGGIGGPGAGPSRVYATPQDGFNAMASLISRRYGGPNANPWEMANRWVGMSPADNADWARGITRLMGGPSQGSPATIQDPTAYYNQSDSTYTGAPPDETSGQTSSAAPPDTIFSNSPDLWSAPTEPTMQLNDPYTGGFPQDTSGLEMPPLSTSEQISQTPDATLLAGEPTAASIENAQNPSSLSLGPLVNSEGNYQIPNVPAATPSPTPSMDYPGGIGSMSNYDPTFAYGVGDPNSPQSTDYGNLPMSNLSGRPLDSFTQAAFAPSTVSGSGGPTQRAVGMVVGTASNFFIPGLGFVTGPIARLITRAIQGGASPQDAINQATSPMASGPNGPAGGGGLGGILGDLGTSTPYNDPAAFGMAPADPFGQSDPFVGGAFATPAGGSIGGQLGGPTEGDVSLGQNDYFGHMGLQALMSGGDTSLGFAGMPNANATFGAPVLPMSLWGGVGAGGATNLGAGLSGPNQRAMSNK